MVQNFFSHFDIYFGSKMFEFSMKIIAYSVTQLMVQILCNHCEFVIDFHTSPKSSMRTGLTNLWLSKI
jgi:hypothetical protein